MKTLLGALALAALLLSAPVSAQPAGAPPSAAEEAFLLTLASPAPGSEATASIPAPTLVSTSDCARLASECLRANCQCSEDCGGVVAQFPCVFFPRQWRECICG